MGEGDVDGKLGEDDHGTGVVGTRVISYSWKIFQARRPRLRCHNVCLIGDMCFRFLVDSPSLYN